MIDRLRKLFKDESDKLWREQDTASAVYASAVKSIAAGGPGSNGDGKLSAERVRDALATLGKSVDDLQADADALRTLRDLRAQVAADKAADLPAARAEAWAKLKAFDDDAKTWRATFGERRHAVSKAVARADAALAAARERERELAGMELARADLAKL